MVVDKKESHEDKNKETKVVGESLHEASYTAMLNKDFGLHDVLVAQDEDKNVTFTVLSGLRLFEVAALVYLFIAW